MNTRLMDKENINFIAKSTIEPNTRSNILSVLHAQLSEIGFFGCTGVFLFSLWSFGTFTLFCMLFYFILLFVFAIQHIVNFESFIAFIGTGIAIVVLCLSIILCVNVLRVYVYGLFGHFFLNSEKIYARLLKDGVIVQGKVTFISEIWERDVPVEDKLVQYVFSYKEKEYTKDYVCKVNTYVIEGDIVSVWVVEIRGYLIFSTLL